MQSRIFNFVADCPVCQHRHVFELTRDWAESHFASDEAVEIHCIYADGAWTLSKRERENAQKQLAEGGVLL
jgi:hypothetical protein